MELLTVKEVAQILRISRQAVHKKIKKGQLKTIKIGERYRIDKEWLEEYLKNGGDVKSNETINKEDTGI